MSEFVVWQGFEHEWKREILGFRLAHRLSSLVNYIDGNAAMVAGASPGVDGNFMEPVCFYRRASAPGVTCSHRVVELEGTDSLEGDEATIELHGRVECEMSSAAQVCEAILAGIDFTWSCDVDKQPDGQESNSNAVWPSEMSVSIGAAEREGTRVAFPVSVRVVRGWTPMRGGIPLIEEKPLNHAMDLSARVYVNVLDGAEGDLVVQRRDAQHTQARLKDAERHTSAPLPGLTGPGQEVTGITQFGFVMPARKETGALRHRGRYLSAIGFGVDDTSEGPQTWGRLWAPITVVQSDVHYQVSPVLLGFRPEAMLSEQASVRGQVHSNSSDEAPFFSHWKKFESDQTRARVPLDDSKPLG